MQKKNIMIVGGMAAIILMGGIAYYVLSPTTMHFATALAAEQGIEGTVRVQGVIAAAQNVDLSFDRSGRIAAVYAKVGASVHKGDKLVSLENTSEAGQVLQAQATLNQRIVGASSDEIAVYQAAVVAAEAALEPTPSGESLIIMQSKISELASITGTQPKLEDGLSQADAILGVDIFVAKDPALGATDKSTVSNAALAYQVAKNSLKVFRDEVVTLDANTDNGKIVATAMDAERALNDMNTLLAQVAGVLNASAPQGSLTVESLNSKKATIQAARIGVQTQLTTLQNAIQGVDAARAVVAQKQAALEQAKAALAVKQNSPRETDVAPLRAAVASASGNYEKTIIRSPIDGVVARQDAKIGGIALSNQALVSVVNQNSYQMESYVSQADVAKIAVGNAVTMTTDAYGTDVLFAATVASVDQSASTYNGESGYKVVFQFTQPDQRIKAGMTANAIINVARKDNVIVVPQSSVLQKNGRYFVMVDDGAGGTAEREVSVGIKSQDGTWEITSGLKAGEIIVNFGK